MIAIPEVVTEYGMWKNLTAWVKEYESSSSLLLFDTWSQ